nr:hypothetical protein MarFTME_499 [Marseillevirus futianmevirus]
MGNPVLRNSIVAAICAFLFIWFGNVLGGYAAAGGREHSWIAFVSLVVLFFSFLGFCVAVAGEF